MSLRRRVTQQAKHSPGGQPTYKGMPPLTSYFVMRREPWDNMTRGLINGDAEKEKQKIMVISGKAGCGKTQLVIRFTKEKEFKSRFKFVFFIDGSSRESIQADIINRVRAANSAYSQATFAEALSFFYNPCNSPWMAIYHNVDDVGIDLSSLIPKCSFGTIIITTRTQARGQLASPSDLHIQLDVMSQEEAIETILLSANMKRTDDTVKSVRSVANELGNLPVALVLAGSYMRQSRCSCEEYLELMYKPAGDRLQSSAYRAFDLSFQRLQPFVQNFLYIIGSLHHADFPMKAIAIAAATDFSFDQFSLIKHDANFKECVEILKSIFFTAGTWDEGVLDNILTELDNYSLASFTRSRLLHTHPFICQWTLDHLTPEKQASYRLTASRLLACSCNEDTLLEFLMPHIDALIPQLPDSPKVIYDKATFGRALRMMGRDKDSKAIWEPIYNAIVQRGKQDLQMATVALELAAVSTSDLEKMEKLQKQAIGIRESLLGLEDLETLYAKEDLCETYRLQGRLRDAESLCLEILDRLKKRLGPTHDEVIPLTQFLGELYRSQRSYSEAESIHEDLLKIRKERLGSNHVDTLSAMHELAITYNSQSRHSDAEGLQQDVVNKRKKQLGDTHVDTLRAMDNLAWTYHLQGRHSDAEPLQEQVLEIQKEQLGDTHVDTLHTMYTLALTYHSQGRHSDAEPLQEHVLKIRKEQLGDTHVDTVQAMDNLALTYRSRKRHSDAELLQRNVLKIRKEQLGNTHIDTHSAMHELAVTYYSQGNYSAARPLQEKVLEERRKLHGEHDLKTAVSMNSLGWTYYCLGMFSQAKELAMRAEPVRRDLLGVNHPHYKNTAELLQRSDEALVPRPSLLARIFGCPWW